MDVICPVCNTVYRVADRKIPKNRAVTATCKKCGRKLAIRATAASAKPALLQAAAGSSPRIPEPISPVFRAGTGADARAEDAKSKADFSARKALRFGWSALKRDPIVVIVGMFVVPACIQMVLDVFTGLVPRQLWPIRAGLIAVAFVLELAVALGIAGISLKICDGRPTGLRDLHANLSRTGTYLISSILFALLCFGGLIAFVVPGILLSLWLQFYGFAIVDEKTGPVAALKKSYALTRGRLLPIVSFSCLAALINFLGLLFLGMGLLITVPVSFIAWAYLYRSLQGRTPQPMA